MSCVRCGALTSYKLSTKARDILGYSSEQKGKITLFRKIKNDL